MSEQAVNIDEECLLCARYGEPEELKQFIDAGASLSFQDHSGNTALHFASANGHVSCVEILLSAGSPHVPNAKGNTPFQWAVVNKSLDVVKLLVKQVKNLNVLDKNSFGQSALSDAFNAQNPDILATVLEHPSAAELEGSQATSTKEENEDDASNADADADGEHKVQHYTHTMCFKEGGPQILVQEIGTEWFGQVFGETAEEDRTGIQLWAASLIMARWIVDLAPAFQGKRVLELGAGCGLPGLATLAYTEAANVTMSDVFAPTVENLEHNIRQNEQNFCVQDRAHTATIDWFRKESWPEEEYDLVIGCDLVYDLKIVPHLVSVLNHYIKPGTCFYYVSGGKRQGAKEFVQAVRDSGYDCIIHPLLDTYKENPLVDKPQSELELHFNELHECQQMLFEFRRVAVE